MSEVSPVGSGHHQHGSVGPVGRVPAQPHQRNGVVPGRIEPQPRSADRVELSDQARFINRMRDMPDVRMDRVEAAKAAIQQPDFASGERLNVAIERMIDDLRLDEQIPG